MNKTTKIPKVCSECHKSPSWLREGTQWKIQSWQLKEHFVLKKKKQSS